MFLYLTGRSLAEAWIFTCEDVDFDRLEIRLGTLRENWMPGTIPLEGLEHCVEELKLKEAASQAFEQSGGVSDQQAYENDDNYDGPPLFCTTKLRKRWRAACIRLGLGQTEQLPGEREVYRGLLVRHLRRSAIRNMFEAGVEHEVAMKIAGYRQRENAESVGCGNGFAATLSFQFCSGRTTYLQLFGSARICRASTVVGLSNGHPLCLELP